MGEPQDHGKWGGEVSMEDRHRDEVAESRQLNGAVGSRLRQRWGAGPGPRGGAVAGKVESGG